MSDVRTEILRAQRALLNGSGKLSYFERRGLKPEVVRAAWIGFVNGAFSYPCIAKKNRTSIGLGA